MTFNEATEAVRGVLGTDPSGATRYELHYRPDPFRLYYREYFPSEALKNAYGVYLILDMADRVLYIGKAASANLFRETYSKFNTPSLKSPLFPRHCWTGRGLGDAIRGMVEAGEVRLAFVTLPSGDAATELERYLQELALRVDGALPPLNARIG